MPAPISMDLRQRLVAAVEAGSSIREAARRFAVAPSTAIKLMQRVHATGSPRPGQSGHRPQLLAGHETTLSALLAATPDLTLAELQTELARRTGIVAGLTTLHKTLLDKSFLSKSVITFRRIAHLNWLSPEGRSGAPREAESS